MDIAHRFFMARFKNPVMTEVPNPFAVQKTVDFSEACLFILRRKKEGTKTEFEETLRYVVIRQKVVFISIEAEPRFCSPSYVHTFKESNRGAIYVSPGEEYRGIPFCIGSDGGAGAA